MKWSDVGRLERNKSQKKFFIFSAHQISSLNFRRLETKFLKLCCEHFVIQILEQPP